MSVGLTLMKYPGSRFQLDFLVGILFIILDLEVVFLFPCRVIYIIMEGWELELCIYFHGGFGV